MSISNLETQDENNEYEESSQNYEDHQDCHNEEELELPLEKEDLPTQQKKGKKNNHNKRKVKKKILR
jgi:hypothetical protein